MLSSRNKAEIKRDDTLRFCIEGSDEIIEGHVLNRGGKAGGKHERWWNIEDCKTGVRKGYDTDTFSSIEKVPAHASQVEEVFVLQVPRFLHNDDNNNNNNNKGSPTCAGNSYNSTDVKS